ncbi:MAG: insulinase family protein [Deltaproteobacteria bacterium]|nr:insulinase family protein [Deltaproteobacteria bacterium]
MLKRASVVILPITLPMAVAAVLIFGTLSCASKGQTPTAESSGYDVSESTGDGITVLRKHREVILSNGLKVLFMPDQSLPSLSIGLVIKTGSALDPVGSAGLANLVSDLLDQGTKKRNAIQIADDLGRIGAVFRASVDYDYTHLGITGLSFSSNEILSNFLELTTQPSFTDAEFNRMKKQLVAGIERSFDNPRVVADVASAKFLFGDHPYGRSVSGTATEVASLTKKSVIQHYLKFYRPGNSILVVVGQFDPQFEKKVETDFGAWAKRDLEPGTIPEPIPVAGVRVLVVDKPGLTQAQIRISAIGIKRMDENFLPLRVANTVFGGAFASRLNDRIRKELGLTYSISSGFDARLTSGPFEIDTFTKTDSIEKVVMETIAMYKKFVEAGITSEELKRARGYLSGIFPQAIETSDKLAFNMLLLRNYGISDRYLTHYVRDLGDISASEVNTAIKKTLVPGNLSIVIHAPSQAAESLKGKVDKFEIVPAASIQ